MLRSQIAGLARTIYAGEVPEEFQMLLGMEIPAPTKQVIPAESPENTEPELTNDQKIEQAEAERQRGVQAELRYRMKLRPSTVGPMLSRIIKQDPARRATKANPSVAMMFDQAKAEVIGK